MSKEDLELLKFYSEVGIDCTLKEDLEDERSDEKDTKSFKEDFFPSDYIVEARRLSNKCTSIDELRNAVESFEGCEIKKTSTNTVFSDGNSSAKVMLIGEAPGANEDLQGIPFCGVSGKLLDKMLNAISLDRTKVYISNVVFWHPPGNRKPTDLELDTCRPFVEKHIALIAPQILILVGGIACYSLLDNTKTISHLRGKFLTYSNQYLSHPITTTAIFHPAYLLRQPLQKRLAWEDLKMIRDYLSDKS